MTGSFQSNRSPLIENAFSFLPLGSIKPRGWLKNQLQIQADGLSGHLDEFWPDLCSDNGWLGGKGESWERGPYYIDGLLPLAYLLEDERLITKANRWIEWTLENQSEDGWIGPSCNQDWWAVTPMLKALTQYQEVTGDPRVIPLMECFFENQRAEMPNRPLASWATFRWADTALSAIWLYQRTGNPKLLTSLRLLLEQGYDWTDHFLNFQFTGKTVDKLGAEGLDTHVVNAAMGVKSPGIAYVISGLEEHRKAAQQALSVLDRYHGQVNGVFSGDEHYAGKDPTQGTELCAVVELMFSLEHLAAILGEARFGDRLEKIVFNALPATFSPDMWAHQYDQQVNQVLCTVAKRHWTNNNDDSNTFGLEPNYGCCTSNMHQGWPKFTSHLWMATPDGGLAAIAYAPCEVKAVVADGSPITLEVETEYPFDDTIRIRVKASQPAKFPLWLRIPSWADKARLSVSGTLIEQNARNGFQILDRVWTEGDVIELQLPMSIRVTQDEKGSVSLERGPLVYSLKIGEEWRYLKGEKPHADYEVYPTTPWNYGLAFDSESPEQSIQVIKKPVGSCPFSPDGAPVELHLMGKRLLDWQMVQNSAGPLPESPVQSEEPEEELTLIPYGSTNLRITIFPKIINN